MSFSRTVTNGVRSQEKPPQSNTRYPLPPDAPYKFGRKGSEYLEPVGEFHEFQSAEGNSRQVLLHVWPPSSLDITLLQKLEQACKDFQEHEVIRGHSGDGFLNGWRPSWKKPQQTGVLRFGHWRVRAPADHGTDLYVCNPELFGGLREYKTYPNRLSFSRFVGSISDTIDTCSCWRLSLRTVCCHGIQF